METEIEILLAQPKLFFKVKSSYFVKFLFIFLLSFYVNRSLIALRIYL